MADGIPAFRTDGYLPNGIYVCSEAEATFRFGSQNRRRRRLAIRIRRWCQLGRAIGALRFLLDGSYVTVKEEPEDVDAVMRLPRDFAEQLERGVEAAVELEEMFVTRQPEEIFAAEDDADWQGWCDFFSRTRESDDRHKGLVEIAL